MSNKKQTAVEWLEAYLKTYTSFNLHKIIEKAKEIEKEQIIAACNQIEVFGKDHELPGEQYYKETYEDRD
tara:strand:+ start:455 stop:664 length:210 start_codon:yes stop_codon:yes gene_type:complete